MENYVEIVESNVKCSFLQGVKVENNDWSATTENKSVLPVGTEIVVQAIEGVKLIVKPAKDTVVKI